MASDKLIQDLVKSINKGKKGFDVAHLLGTAGDKAASNVKDWISTGSTMLDLAVSNRPNGGIATGRLIELQGLEGSGKSLIGSHILAATQKEGGIAIYIDTESAVSIDFLRVIGVDVNKLIYIQLETLEDVYQTVEDLIFKIRESNKDKLVTILIDSLSATTTEMEQDSDYGRDGWSTGKAIINSKAMRKITNMIAKERIALVVTSQVRQKLGVSFGDKYGTSGGLAVGFHSSTRIRLNKALKIKDKEGEIIGLYIKAKILKSRLGPSFRTVEFPLYFSSGIDDDTSWLLYLKSKKLAKGGAWNKFDYTDDKTGEVTKLTFRAKDWSKLLDETFGLRQFVYKLICDTFIMKYEVKDFADIDSVKIEKDIDQEDLGFEGLNKENAK